MAVSLHKDRFSELRLNTHEMVDLDGCAELVLDLLRGDGHVVVEVWSGEQSQGPGGAFDQLSLSDNSSRSSMHPFADGYLSTRSLIALTCCQHDQDGGRRKVHVCVG